MVENEGINIEQYSLLVAVHSNSFTNVWSQSARYVPLTDWLNNAAYTRAWLDDLAKKLNSAEVVEPERDGFLCGTDLSQTTWQRSREKRETKKSLPLRVGDNGQEKEVRHTHQKTTMISVLPEPS